MGINKNPELYADFETVEKNVKNLPTKELQAKQVCKIRVSPLWQINDSTFFKLFERNWNQRKILRIFDVHMQKKIAGGH